MASKRKIRGRDTGITPFVLINPDSLQKELGSSVKGDDTLYTQVFKALIKRHPMIRKIVQDSYSGHVDQLLLPLNNEDLRWYVHSAIRLLRAQGLEFHFDGLVVQDSLGHTVPLPDRNR